MPNTYSQIYIQMIFAVKGRECFIKESFREELQKYISGIVSNKKQKLYSIYCMPDHTHLFVSMKPDMAVSDLVRDIKSNSSSFIKEKKWVNSLFSWQGGFGAFSYSKSQGKAVVDYILTQPEHHSKITFREEYLDFLKNMKLNTTKNICLNFMNN